MPKPLATWNRARGVWETEQASLLCAHWVPFSLTWPNWGTTRAGTAYAQPMWEHLTADSAYSSSPGLVFDTPDTNPERPNTGSNRVSQVAGLGNQVRGLLPTPVASDWKGPNRSASGSASSRGMATVAESLLPTPTASDRFGPGDHGDGGPDLRTAVDTLLPTPTARDHKGHNQRQDDSCLTGALLPTPRATDGTKGGPNQRGSSGDLMLPSAVMLLPTPTVGNVTGGNASRSGNRSDELLLPGVARAITEGMLLPTPITGTTSSAPPVETLWTSTTREGSAPASAEESVPTLSGDDLAGSTANLPLMATPRVSASRTGRSAAVRRDSMSSPSLEQCIEIAQGILPREFTSWDELPPSWHGDRTSQPSADGSAA